MNDWHTLTKAALLGTRRTAVPTLPPHSPAADLLAALAGDDPAHQLLATAGTLALQQNAGRLPTRAAQSDTPPPLAAADEWPTCSRRAAQRLDTILGGTRRPLLREFLAALQRHQQRIPEHLLPALLTHGAKMAHTRPIILPVLGARGRWLARQNPAWVFASPALEQWDVLLDVWRAADKTGRQGLLRQLRHTRPAVGRDLIATEWHSANGHTRYHFIKQFDVGLAMADEPFLERALDDRSHLVRREAAARLSNLPDSRYASRMRDYAPRFLTWTPWHKHKINLHFPEITPAMLRDGLLTDSSTELARLRERQITHLVSSVPLDHWTTIWDTTPTDIVAAIPTTRWQRTLTNGFTQAALRQRNVDWALALLVQDNYSLRTTRLFALLDAAQATTAVQTITASQPAWQPLQRKNPLFALLRTSSVNWSTELAEFWLRDIGRTMLEDSATSLNAMQRSAFVRFARHCPTTLHVTAVDHLWPAIAHNAKWTTTVKEILSILDFRHAMLTEIETG